MEHEPTKAMREEPFVKPLIVTAVGTADVGGNAVERRNPAKAVMALEMLAEGKTYDQVCAATGLGYDALMALRGRHGAAIEDRRKQLAADGFEMAEGLRLLARKKLSMLAEDEEQLKKVHIKDLILPYAIAQDKAFAAMGENKVVVEHRGKGITLEEAQAAIDAAKKRIMEEAIDVTPVKDGGDSA